MTREDTQARIVCDSLSCRAFSQRQGVGKLKHINVKYLWLQQKVKEGALCMEGVPTILNLADLGIKGLAKARRAFLMFLIGLFLRTQTLVATWHLVRTSSTPISRRSWENYEISASSDAGFTGEW